MCKRFALDLDWDAIAAQFSVAEEDVRGDVLPRPSYNIAPTQNIAATFVEDGGQTEGEIAAGTRFVITASDKTSVAWFQTEDGREGYFSIAPDEERGWGCTVNGVPESELFEMVPYAD